MADFHTLTKKDLHTPFTSKTIEKLLAHFDKAWSEQATATDATLAVVNGTPVARAGKVRSIVFLADNACAAGESMVVDVLKNGVSILSATFTYDSTKSANTLYELSVTTDAELAVGDVLTVSRDYTAGGGPTPLVNTKVVIFWS